jgi:xanthine dehydrogenase iron-sulfur cluster and FAD-binding subunit A
VLLACLLDCFADQLLFVGCAGTKFMCGEGGCGSCTVAIDMADDTGATKTLAINSCLRPLASCHGLNVRPHTRQTTTLTSFQTDD